VAVTLVSFAAVLSVPFFVYSVFIAPRRRLVREVRVTMESLPRPFSLLFIADLHLHGRIDVDLRQLRRFWNGLRSSGIECVLLGGDILERDIDAEAIAAGLRAAFEDLPILCVFGNHDVVGPDAVVPTTRRRNELSTVRSSFATHSITILEDEARTVQDLTILGAAWSTRAYASTKLRDEVSRILGARVVLAHSPDQLVGLAANGDVAALCGHTHGGQVDLPWLRSPILFLRNRLPRASGVMRIGNLRTFVTTGWGQTYPLRIRVRPEIVVVRLVERRPGEIESMSSRRVRT
jgi:predicted MPP superfamily phosphohydrolase